jgi:DNA-directed RNA polymerase specialized sigma54-like protein
MRGNATLQTTMQRKKDCRRESYAERIRHAQTLFTLLRQRCATILSVAEESRV